MPRSIYSYCVDPECPIVIAHNESLNEPKMKYVRSEVIGSFELWFVRDHLRKCERCRLYDEKRRLEADAS